MTAGYRDFRPRDEDPNDHAAVAAMQARLQAVKADGAFRQAMLAAIAASSAKARGGVPGQHIKIPPEKSLSVSRLSRSAWVKRILPGAATETYIDHDSSGRPQVTRCHAEPVEVAVYETPMPKA